MKKRISGFYDSFLAEHSYREDFSSPRLNAILRNIEASDKISPILDAGCGAGSLSRLLAGAKPENTIIGIDISRESIKYAQKKLADIYRNLNLVVGDLESLPFKDSSFKYIICSEVLEHVLESKRQKVLSEFYRVAHFRGRLFLTTPNGMHFFILLRKLLGWISKGRLRSSITTQIYDKPLFPHSSVGLLRLSKWKIISFSFTNYSLNYKSLDFTITPKLPIFALQLFVEAYPAPVDPKT